MSVTNNNYTYRVADAHAHIYPGKIAEKATAAVGDFYSIDMQNLGLPRVLKEMGEKAGVEKYLVSSVATKAGQSRPISEFIANKSVKYPEFVGLGAWHQDLSDIDAEFDFIMNLGLKGIKLHPDFQKFNIDDQRMMDTYREAARRRLPILFHTGDNRTDFSSPCRLAKVMEKIPDLICIGAHLGGYRQRKEAVETLRGSGIYIDTSSSLFYLSKDEAVESISCFGADHTMFGTDFPMWSPASELERFFALGLTEDENKRILYDNFAALFSL